MKEIDEPFEVPEGAIKRAYYYTINGETGDIFTPEMQESLRKEGYEHFRDRIHIKLDNGNYIVNQKFIEALRQGSGDV